MSVRSNRRGSVGLTPAVHDLRFRYRAARGAARSGA